MVLSSTIQTTLLRHQRHIDSALRAALQHVQATSAIPALSAHYGQMQYHLGWLDMSFQPTKSNPGKLLRPTLLLLAYEAAGAWELADSASNDTAYLQRALPAAVSIELTHNFTLIHDDIEDGDTERRHRPTLWKTWGVPQAINVGDGMYALARSVLWDVLENGVDAASAVRLAQVLDRTVLFVAEGQYLDISFEDREDISVAMYIDMISRKTAALLGCAAEMGGLLGTRNSETIERLKSFGNAIGIAFQVRDDLLGVWASTSELGKSPAGDIYRRKKSLPILHALEQANPTDQATLHAIYQQTTQISREQVAEVLAIFERTQTQAYCRSFLAQHCQLAKTALKRVPAYTSAVAARALEDMQAIIHFIEDAAS